MGGEKKWDGETQVLFPVVSGARILSVWYGMCGMYVCMAYIVCVVW